MPERVKIEAGAGDGSSSRRWLVALIAVLVVGCLCLLIAGAGWALWTYGDQWLGLTYGVASYFLG
jgi:Mg/Co/Ni transporter MgtE